jgi:hypothetical protein
MIPTVVKYAIEAYCERSEGPTGPLVKLSMHHRKICSFMLPPFIRIPTFFQYTRWPHLSRGFPDNLSGFPR